MFSFNIGHNNASKYLIKEYEPGYGNLSFRKTCKGLNIQSKCDRNSAAKGVIFCI